MQRAWFAILVFVASLAVTACGAQAGVPTAAPTGAVPAARLLEPADFKREIAGRFLVNVHVPDEGNIAGTSARIPFDQLRARSAELPADKNAPLAVYCKSGRMSAIAARDLQTLGYSNVIELSGGMNAWEQAGFTLSYP